MAVNLSEGSIDMMCNGDKTLFPILQVIDVRLVVSSSSAKKPSDRYRLLLSDGVHIQQGMLATQMNHFIDAGRMQKYSVVQLLEYVCNTVQERKIIVVLKMEMVLDKCDPIGDPKQYIIGAPRAPPQAQSAQSSLDQTGAVSRTAQHGSPQSSGAVPDVNPSVSGPPLRHVKMEGRSSIQSHGLVLSGSECGRSAANTSSATASMGSLYGDQKGGFQNLRTVPSRNPMGMRPPQPYQHSTSMYTNRGPIARNEAGVRPIPIAALNPYQGRWTIKARVTAKTELRHYNNPRGDGKVFSFDLLDNDGGEIRVTCFNAVADQFFNQIDVGRVYLISKGTLKPAQKNFNHLRNDHEIFLDTTSVVQPCLEDDNSIPPQQFDFRPIIDIESMENNSIIDVIGVVSSVSPPVSIMRKNGTETQKRSLQLKDMSGRSVELTLWGNFCNSDGQTVQRKCDSGRYPVLAVKSARVNDFNGKTIGTISHSQLFIDSDFIPEVRKIREWYDCEGQRIPFVSISREQVGSVRTDARKVVAQIKDEKLGTSEKPDWITVSVTITHVKEDNFCYTACPRPIGDRQCSKKVTNNGDGKWWCDKCETSVDECEYRYILQLQIQDHSGSTWATAFQECGEAIMGVSAKELQFLKYEEQDDFKYREVINGVRFHRYLLKLKVKEETFSDEQRVKSTIVKAERIDFSSESKFLLDLMNNIKIGEPTPPPVLPGTTQNAERNSSRFIGAGIGQAAVTSSYGNSGDRGLGGSGYQGGQYVNHHAGSGRYPTGNQAGVYTSCSDCGAAGHSSTNCPKIKDGTVSSSTYIANRTNPGIGTRSAGSECYKCHQTGHWARDCPAGVNDAPPAYGSGSAPPGRFGGVQRQHVGGF